MKSIVVCLLLTVLFVGYIRAQSKSNFLYCLPYLKSIDKIDTIGCGRGARFSRCGTACPITCDNYRRPPQACTYNCVIGCECVPGFAKVSRHSQRCVPIKECRLIG